MPSTPLPATAAPGKDVRLAYSGLSHSLVAALPLLLLVPLLILVVQPGDPKRARREEPRVNIGEEKEDEQNTRSSATQSRGDALQHDQSTPALTTPREGGGTPEVLSQESSLPFTTHNSCLRQPACSSVYNVMKDWIDKCQVQNILANLQMEYEDLPDQGRQTF